MMKQATFLCLTALLLCSCNRNEQETYQVPKSPEAKSAQPAPSVKAVPSVEIAGFSRTLPEGWKEALGTGMRMMSYSMEGRSVDFYLIALGMGDLTSNVNRWRGQVGLSGLAPDVIDADAEVLVIDGRPARYVELYNKENGKGIIAVIIDLAPQYWYFTAKGSAQELQDSAPEIRAFLKSIRFNK